LLPDVFSKPGRKEHYLLGRLPNLHIRLLSPLPRLYHLQQKKHGGFDTSSATG